MHHAPAPHRPDPVQVVIEDVPELEDRVREAARRALECDRALELVEPAVAEGDHAARACIIRHMDEALALARRVAPGVEIRVAAPIEIPHPRGTL